jgi:hypothetical protein
MYFLPFKTYFEHILFVLFLLYFILPIKSPLIIEQIINSYLGIVLIFLIIVWLFIYTHPVLGILFLFIAYKLINQTNYITTTANYVTYTVPTVQKEKDMEKMNPPIEKTLEEITIDEKSPIGHSNISQYENSTYKPIVENNNGASVFN